MIMECISYFLRESSDFCNRVMKACWAVSSFSAASATSLGSLSSHVDFLLLSGGPWYSFVVEHNVPSGARCLWPLLSAIPWEMSLTAIVKVGCVCRRSRRLTNGDSTCQVQRPGEFALTRRKQSQLMYLNSLSQASIKTLSPRASILLRRSISTVLEAAMTTQDTH
jgi:hypothetical protein